MAKNKTNGQAPVAARPTPTLTKEEYEALVAVQTSRAHLRSELEKLDLIQENVFLKASVRLGVDLSEWGVDLKTKTFVERPKPPASSN